MDGNFDVVNTSGINLAIRNTLYGNRTFNFTNYNNFYKRKGNEMPTTLDINLILNFLILVIMGLISYNWKKVVGRVDKLEEEIDKMRGNYLDRFDDIKECYSEKFVKLTETINNHHEELVVGMTKLEAVEKNTGIRLNQIEKRVDVLEMGREVNRTNIETTCRSVDEIRINLRFLMKSLGVEYQQK